LLRIGLTLIVTAALATTHAAETAESRQSMDSKQVHAAGPAPSHSIPWQTLDGGGGVLSVVSQRLEGSIGQWDVDGVSFLAAGRMRLSSGFWTGAAAGSERIHADGFESP
jgi:hypothetical protein